MKISVGIDVTVRKVADLSFCLINVTYWIRIRTNVVEEAVIDSFEKVLV